MDTESLADNGQNGATPPDHKQFISEIPFCQSTPTLLDGLANGGWLEMSLPTGPMPKPRNTMGTRGQERGE
jgi:hypothetical protein